MNYNCKHFHILCHQLLSAHVAKYIFRNPLEVPDAPQAGFSLLVLNF